MTALPSEKEMEQGLSPYSRLVDGPTAKTIDFVPAPHSIVKTSICGLRSGWRWLCGKTLRYPDVSIVALEPAQPSRSMTVYWFKTSPISEKILLLLFVLMTIFLGWGTVRLVAFGSTVFRPECKPGSITSKLCKWKVECTIKNLRKIQTYSNTTADLQCKRSEMDQIQRLLDDYAYNVENCMNYKYEDACLIVVVLGLIFQLWVFWRVQKRVTTPSYELRFREIATQWCAMFYQLPLQFAIYDTLRQYCPV